MYKEEIIKSLKIFQSWFLSHGIKVLLIFISAYIVLKFSRNIVTKFIRRVVRSHHFTSPEEEKKREDTLIEIIQSILAVLVWSAAIFFILSELGVPLAPLITGASVIGVALGFGAQSLVKDIINGLFIIMENQYRIGDVVCIGDYCGTVEDITLRITKLRNLDGTVYHIPNGEVKTSSNMSKDFSMVNFSIGVAYQTDIDHLENVINKVGEDLAADERYAHDILEAPHFLKIGEFGDSAIVVHIIGKVYPKKQYHISAEMKKRLKKAFEREGIEIPYPTRTVYLQK